MTTDQAQIGGGDVPVKILGKPYTLKPGWPACSKLSRGEGLVLLSSRCNSLEIDALTRVIAAGLSREPDEDLAEKLYKTGLSEIRDACLVYISALANGGSIPKPVKEAMPPLGDESGQTTS